MYKRQVSFILNIPLFFLGWRFLGGRRFLARTVAASLLFSVILDGLQLFWPGVKLSLIHISEPTRPY